MYTADSAVETSRFMISVKEKKQIRDKIGRALRAPAFCCEMKKVGELKTEFQAFRFPSLYFMTFSPRSSVKESNSD